ncbi:hypothetical protein RFI_24901 [Reticulomyxa filosa]|uniref:F-box domain-containing protein n=1 Tax=Reticulomyxa filosa TaxID=46433 RepID=X6MGE4_RETFI|nr:hypothetical protein RFI_24901 [Reticulomyxa filosa]|eukprot:ETO12477.1 hypothetical protein RFI_24901 [Reticulomyxa filosa]
MDDLFFAQLNKLADFETQIENFESEFLNQSKELEEIQLRRDAEFDLWKATFSSEISHYQSDIQSKQLSLLGTKLKLETTKAAHALEQQKTFTLQTECNKLKRKYEKLKKRIKEQVSAFQFGNLEEADVNFATSLHYQREYILPGPVFHTVLSFCDLQTIFVCGRVSKSWRKGINYWLGWLNPSYKHIHDLNEIFQTTTFGPKKTIASPSFVSSLDTKDSDALFYQKFRRFVLAIETQKSNTYKVEVIGFADKTTPVQSNVVHDRNKRKVILQPIEGDPQLQKEYSICEVILSNHQKLAKIKAQTERFKNRV